jgi:predicted Ser/Thr protein kinase
MIGETIASRYRVLREIGRGAMGVVYLVEHTRTGEHLALKLLQRVEAGDEETLGRFKREARASAYIRSEHVVKIVDADTAPELAGAPFLVMELLNGIDLDKQLRKEGRMASEVVFHYLSQAASALDKSHALGIVHRDLKPENLFIHHREDGSTTLKILDFGISKVIGGDRANEISSASMTRTGAIMGTPFYMSPEQARGRVSEIGPTTDVWAVGLVALQLLTGEIYWQAGTSAELMSFILSEPLYAPSSRWTWLPSAIDPWFARSCARRPTERFPSVGLQIQELGVALGVAPEPGMLRVEPMGGAATGGGSGPGSTLAAPEGWPFPIDGARTTTNAIAQERPQPVRRGRPGPRFAMAAAALAVTVALSVLGLSGRRHPGDFSVHPVTSGNAKTSTLDGTVVGDEASANLPSPNTSAPRVETATGVPSAADTGHDDTTTGDGKREIPPDAGKSRHPGRGGPAPGPPPTAGPTSAFNPAAP